MTVKKHAPTILDVEASGFGSNSYPIEIGVIHADGRKFCRLIKPFEDWRHWDNEAEMLHGIQRHELDKFGCDPVSVCNDLNRFMEHSTAYSDGWVVDSPWLIKLFSRAGVKMTFTLSAIEYLLNQKQMDTWHSVKRWVTKQQAQQRHRASVVADIIQKTFVYSMYPPAQARV